MFFQPFCTTKNCKSKTINPVGLRRTAYLHLSPLTWPPLGQVGHGVEGACCRGWWMSSLFSPMWFCLAFFSMLLCTLKTKCALLCFIKIISHLHLLQHYRTHSLHPGCHTFWECQRVQVICTTFSLRKLLDSPAVNLTICASAIWDFIAMIRCSGVSGLAGLDLVIH